MSVTTPGFYVTGGTLPPGTPSYVPRRADNDLYEGLVQGAYCYVLHARQMGKSSLMVHTTARLRQEGVAVAAFELTALGQNLTVEQWYDGLLSRIGRELDLEDELEEYWLDHERLAPLQRWMSALQAVVLKRCPGRIVLFLDEIDAVRSLPFSTDEFFAAIRECYNRRSQDPEFGRLVFCLLGVATPSDLIQDTRTTPFNIGRRIELTDFTAAEAAPLAQGLGRTPPPTPPLQGEGSLGSSIRPARGAETEAPPSLAGKGAGGLGPAQTLLQRVLYWTGGHPYLTQRLCQAVAEDETVSDPAGVDRHCEALFLSPQAQERDDNLLFVRERLLKSEADRASLLDLYAQVHSGKRVRLDDTNQLVSLLRLSGLTRVVSGSLRVRNRIYARVFDRRWVTQHMPDAELRRQRAAFRRGLGRAAAVSAVIVTALGSLSFIAVRQTGRAEQQRRVAEQQRVEARHNLYAAQMNMAQQSWEQSDPARALELLEAWRPEPGQEDLRGFEWRYLWQLCRDTQGLTLNGHGDGVGAVAFSPLGRLVASGSDDRTVKLWDLASKRVLATLTGHRGIIDSIAFSPTGQTLASGSQDNTVKLWDVGSRREIATLRGHKDRITALAFSPDGTILASGSDDFKIKLWNLAVPRLGPVPAREPWQTMATLAGHGDRVRSVAFSPDGKTLASGSQDNTVKLWNLASRREAATLKGHRDWVLSVAFSPDGRTLASASDASTVKLWNVASRREVATLNGHKSRVAAVAFSPTGKLLASASRDHTVKLWDLATRQEMTTFTGHTDQIRCVAYSPDGQTIASGSYDRTVRLWKPAAERNRPLARGNGAIYSIAFSPDGRSLAFGNQTAGAWKVELWAITPRHRIATFRGHTAIIHSIAFSPDGRTVASGSDDSTVKLWDVSSRRLRGSLPGSVGGVGHLAFSPDGKILANGTGEGPIHLWEVASRREVAILKGHHRPVWSIAFSPDDKILATASVDGTGKLWDVASRREIHLPGTGVGEMFAFSSDRQTLITGGGSTLKQVELTTGRSLATFKEPTSLIQAVALSPDGQTLAASGTDDITLWNLPIRQPVATLKGHTGPVYALAFSSDGSTLASAGADGAVRLWQAAHLHEGDPLRLASVSSSDRAVTLRWRPVPGALGYNLYRSWTKLTPQPVVGTRFTDRGSELVNGQPQTYRVVTLFRRADGRVVEAEPGPGRLSVRVTPVAVPPDWLGCSINEGDTTGMALFEAPPGAITLRGSGAGIENEADGGYFLNQPVTGDFQVTVQALTRPTFTAPEALAGLMLRESLDPGGRNACLALNAALGITLQWRPTSNGSTEAPGSRVIDDEKLRLPITLRLRREGASITATYSTDNGGNFSPAGGPVRFDPPLARTLHVGLVISAHNISQLSEAKFSALQVQQR